MLKKKFSLLTVLLGFLFMVGLNIGSYANATPLFFDDFNSGASSQWGNEVGSWTDSGGIYQAQFPSNNPLTYSSLSYNLTDFSFEVDINQVQDGGIWLRSSDNMNGILLVTGGRGRTGTGLYWHVVQNGNTGAILNEASGLFTSGVSNINVRVDVVGNTYSAFLNDILVTSLVDNTFSNGRAALYDFSAQTFDNVQLSDLSSAPVPEPSTVFLLGFGLVGLVVYRKKSRLT